MSEGITNYRKSNLFEKGTEISVRIQCLNAAIDLNQHCLAIKINSDSIAPCGIREL